MVFSFKSDSGREKFNELVFGLKKPYGSFSRPPLIEHLHKIGLTSFILESEYIDKDYIKDYANYYARCFYDYKKYCKRLHFFSCSITNSSFHKALEENDESFFKKMQENYLGFMVLKPIPNKIGRTCIKTYSEDNFKVRRYPATRTYEANLFGIDLKIRSLAYQEQDGSVAVCASSALWSAAHKTGYLFHHEIPCPSDITKLATVQTNHIRNFPNNGLTAEQLGVGISGLGLEPQTYTVDQARINKGLIYAYINIGIPIICGLTLYKKKNGHLVKHAKHAVTIVGYSFENGKIEPTILKKEIRLKSSRMTRIYCHDDQLCPFARMTFKSQKVFIDNHYKDLLTTSWIDQSTNSIMLASINVLLTPLYKKIRVPYDAVYRIIRSLEDNFRSINSLMAKHLDRTIPFLKIEWSIFLDQISSLKRELRKVQKSNSFFDKNQLLLEYYPKYIWRTQAWISNELHFEFIFDATDIGNGSLYLQKIIYEEKYYKVIRKENINYNLDGVGSVNESTKRKISKSHPALIKIIEDLK